MRGSLEVRRSFAASASLRQLRMNCYAILDDVHAAGSLVKFRRKRLGALLLAAADAVGDQRDQSQNDGTNAGPSERVDPKTGDQPGRQLENDRVQDNQEQTQG